MVWLKVISGFSEITKAAIPLTIAEENDVPSRLSKEDFGLELNIFSLKSLLEYLAAAT